MLKYEHLQSNIWVLNNYAFDNLLKELVTFNKIRNLNIPSVEDYISFYKFYTQDNNSVRYSKHIYIKSIHKCNSVEELISSEDVESSIRLFIMLSAKRPMEQKLNVVIVFPDRIINYFNMADNEFWSFLNNNINGSERRRQKFLSSIVRILLNLGKANVSELKYEDVEALYTEQYYNAYLKSEHFIPTIEKLIAIYHGVKESNLESEQFEKKKNKFLSSSSLLRKYGTENKDFINLVDKYLETKYIHKDRDIREPLLNLRVFFIWLTTYDSNIDNISKITFEIALRYKGFVLESNLSGRTKYSRLILLNKFFLWLYEIREISELVDLRDRRIVKSGEKSRMFQSREHFKKLLYEIINFLPANEIERLIKYFLLVASSTGLRFNEVRWLGPDCLKSVNDGIGEITLQVREKQRDQNKTTSILPWGLNAINELNRRFYEKEDKVLLFHKQSKSKFYSLFEYEGKLLSNDITYKILRHLFNKADLRDEQGNVVDYKNIKFHAFRHQKFNDIFEVTNGSSTAVKLDSGHKNIGMVKKYTVQSFKKKQIEALRMIEEGKAVGKGVEILKALLNTNFGPLEYIDIVRKMHLSDMQKKDMIISNIKDLGFGYCFFSNCKLRPICVSCDFYFIPENDCDKLKKKYATDYKLLKIRLFSIGQENLINSEAGLEYIQQLKYEEKWLKELGVTEEEISMLRDFCYEDLNHEK